MHVSSAGAPGPRAAREARAPRRPARPAVAPLAPLAIVAALAAATGCEKDDPLARHRARAGEAPPPSVDAGVLAELVGDAGEGVDPAPPAGDLAAELERFTTLDACVTETARLSPLVGDALEAIGYATFLRDACRVLEAGKAKDAARCEPIEASSLRARCREVVALVRGEASLCPSTIEGVPESGRRPRCLAAALRDDRLCAAEGRVGRATCEGLVRKDPKACGALLPAERPGCQREVVRLGGLVGAKAEGLPKLPETRATAKVRGEAGTPDPPKPDLEVEGIARGAVVVTSAVGRARVVVGRLEENPGSRFVHGPTSAGRIGLALLVDPATGTRGTPTATVERLELALPGEPVLTCPDLRCTLTVESVTLGQARGEPVAFRVKGTVAAAARTYAVDVDVATWLRDQVADDPSRRTVAPRIGPLGGIAPAKPAAQPAAGGAGVK